MAVMAATLSRSRPPLATKSDSTPRGDNAISSKGRKMHLLPLSLVLFAALQGQAQPGTQQTADAALTRASFNANGLANERLLTNLYLGNFTEIDLQRSDVLFSGLY